MSLKALFGYPPIKNTGYTFVKYLNEHHTRAVFKIENDLEVWDSQKGAPYGFWFDNKMWAYDFQYEEGNM